MARGRGLPGYRDVDSLESRDPELIRKVARGLEPVLQRWFSPDVRGLDRIPRSAALYAGNHSGGFISPDTWIFAARVLETRGIDVWAALRSLGRQGLADMIDRNCDQAAWLARELASAGIEVLNEVVLNQLVVAFGDDEATERAIAALQTARRCWCGGTRWRGRQAMRISISSWATTQKDIEITRDAIVAAGCSKPSTQLPAPVNPDEQR